MQAHSGESSADGAGSSDLERILAELRRRCIPYLQATVAASDAELRAAPELGAASPTAAVADHGAVPGAGGERGDWRGEELLADGGTLAAALAACGRAAGTDDPLLAASVFVLAYAYVLLAPAIGCLVLDGSLPECAPASVVVLAPRGRPSALAYRRPGLRRFADPARRPVEWDGAELDAALRALHEEAVESHLMPLVAAVRSQVRVGARLLHGNVASAAATALRALEACSGEAVIGVGERFLEVAPDPLREQGAFVIVGRGARRGWLFERRSCCLLDRLPGGVRCADCSLTSRSQRVSAWEAGAT